MGVLPGTLLSSALKMKKFSPFEVSESEEIKFVPGKARRNGMYLGVHGAKAAQQDAYFRSSERIVSCKLRVPSVTRNYTPQNWIISSFSALS